MSARYGTRAPDHQALERAGVALPAILSATVPLARRGTGKWHVILPDTTKRWYGGCRHAQDFTAAFDLPFLDALADICAKCSPLKALDDAVRGLWQACRAIVEADSRARALADYSGPWTWPGYARALAAAAHHEDDTVRGLLKPWLDDPVVGEQAWSALRAWTACVERSHLALAAYQAAAPAADTTAAVSRACDTVAEIPDVYATSSAFATATGRGSRYDWDHTSHTSLWPLVRSAWSAARRQGRTAGEALDFTLEQAGKRWAGASARDVTFLPDPPLVPVGDFPTPSAWADAVLDAWWRQAVTNWCGRLEEALGPDAVGSDERVLLLVRHWPLTRPEDEEIAYLAQFPQIGVTVPDQLGADPRDPYQREPQYAVVLSVPKYAGDQAVEHVRHERGRITAGATFADGDERGIELAASALLRTAYPYLAGDCAGDGAAPAASAEVRAARVAERAARRGPGQVPWPDKAKGRDESLWKWTEALTEGRWTWVPDDTDGGPAGRQLVELLPHCHDWDLMRLHVETGPAGDTAVHTLFGHLEGWDPRRGLLRFRPVDGHMDVTVAQHRIIGLSGLAHRRGAGQPVLWEEYQEPKARPAR